ncbi:MAG TPA: hypothetical protein VGN57_19135 [Pirellulaceae bacterium]|jgi:hypothetical protein|nr:hypothetical protein [Pirellulaceae bacterium]
MKNGSGIAAVGAGFPYLHLPLRVLGFGNEGVQCTDQQESFGRLFGDVAGGAKDATVLSAFITGTEACVPFP